MMTRPSGHILYGYQLDSQSDNLLTGRFHPTPTNVKACPSNQHYMEGEITA
jgi:hypothetical protein